MRKRGGEKVRAPFFWRVKGTTLVKMAGER